MRGHPFVASIWLLALTHGCGGTHRLPEQTREARDGGAATAGSVVDGGPIATEMGGRSSGGGHAGSIPAAGAAGRSALPLDAGATDAAPDASPAFACETDNGGCGDPVRWRCVEDAAGVQCADIDECAVDNGGCESFMCKNRVGLAPECGPCPAGYTGEPSLCAIDECATDNGGCGDPSYVRCEDAILGRSCIDIRECRTDNGGCGDPAQYYCIEQEIAPPLCELNECFADNGGCGSRDQSRCTDAPGETTSCKAKVVAIVGRTANCLLRADQSVDCLLDRGGNVRLSFSGFTHVAAGGGLFCGLSSGAISCDGLPPEFTADVPATADFTAISGSSLHMCALRSDGSVACFGRDLAGSVSGPNTETGVRKVSVASATCVLHEAGTIACYGQESDGEVTAANADPSSDFIDVAAGVENICALHADGTAVCWGKDDVGQVSGLAEAGAGGFTSLSAGFRTICGMRADTSVSCWGLNQFGSISGPNGAGTGIAQVSALYGTACVVWTDGSFRCFGIAANLPNQDVWARPEP